MARANFAAALALGRLGVGASPPDLSALAARHGRGKDADRGHCRFFGELLNGRPHRARARRIALASRRRQRALIPSDSTARSPCCCAARIPVDLTSVSAKLRRVALSHSPIRLQPDRVRKAQLKLDLLIDFSQLMITRRDLLKDSAFLSLSPVVPAFLATTARAAGPSRTAAILVTLQLDGGNDGINTVVPFGDEAYAKYRRELRLPADKLFKIGDGLGLHPSMRAGGRPARRAAGWRSSRGLAIPNPNRSHFESMSIWQTARPGRGARRDTGLARPCPRPVPAGKRPGGRLRRR